MSRESHQAHERFVSRALAMALPACLLQGLAAFVLAFLAGYVS